MKTLKIILGILAFGFSVLAIAQEQKTDSILKNKTNILDMQSNVLTQVFGSKLDGNADGKTIGYIELIEQSELSNEQKTEYKNLYYLIAQELTQKQKDSLGKAIEQKIIEAKETNN